MSAITIMDHFLCHVEESPERLALVCVDRKAHQKWSYQALYKRIVWLAGNMQTMVKPGDRVLILMDSGIDYVSSFFACQYLGVTVIPSFPPESTKAQHIARTIGIAEDSQATLVLTTERFSETVSAMVLQTSHSQMLVVDKLPEKILPVNQYSAKSDDISFLQYTSGSTGKPKGVMVSHANLIANEYAIQESMAMSKDDVGISWLPIFHDMGLIGGLLQGFFVGFPVILASPRYFMEKPVRWLELITQYKGTFSGGPDFAFRLCVDRVKANQKIGLDLSSWRVVASGAEPIRHDTLLDFSEHFVDNGFNVNALYPSYGLAEATLFVTGSQVGQGAVISAFKKKELSEGKAVISQLNNSQNSPAYSYQVSCGVVASKHSLRITCPHSLQALADGHIGEIWVSGPSVALGYWNNDVVTAETFVEREGKRWLRTGDLGYLYDSQLYVSGRKKDLIIMNGHNIFPQDIERSIENSLAFVRKGRVSVFPVSSKESGEGIGLAIETSNRYRNDNLAEQTAIILRDFIISQFSVSPELVLLLEQGALPKTSSGKLQRSACLKLHKLSKLATYGVFNQKQLQGLQVATLSGQSHWQGVEKKLADIWQQVLHSPIRNDEADFFALGGNSIKATQLLAQVQTEFDCHIDPASVFKYSHFGAFCQLVKTSTQDENLIIPLVGNKVSPLSAQQLRQWFLWQLQPKSNAYHIGAVFTLSGQLQPELLQQSCTQLSNKHPILNHKYYKQSDGTVVQGEQAKSLDWHYMDLSGEIDVNQSCLDWIATFNQQAFDLSQGENIRFALIKCSDTVYSWVVVLHHIAGDAWSFNILLEDIANNYHKLSVGEPLSKKYPLKVSYGDYAIWQQQWLTSTQAETQQNYWLQALQQPADELLLVPDKQRQGDSVSPMASTTLQLDHKQVARLQALAYQHGASLFMLLLASLQVLFYRRTGQNSPRIGVPIANRTHSELQSLVGFFVNTQVLSMQLQDNDKFSDVLTRCKETALAGQQNQHLPFDRLVQAINPQRSLGQTPLFQVMFNHVEHDFTMLEKMPDVTVLAVKPLQTQAQFDLSLDSRLMVSGELEIEFQYAQDLYYSSTIEQLKEGFSLLLNQLPKVSCQAIAQLDLLSNEKQRQLLTMGQGSQCQQVTYQQTNESNWLNNISQTAMTEPQRTALIYRNSEYSYQWLEQTSNCLAHGLLAHGINAESIVGIMLARTPLMLASILAVLKAGAAYLPLDNSFPLDKLEHMVEDSACVVILSDEHNAELTFRGQWLQPSILLANFHHKKVSLSYTQHVEQLAYLNYTSGSTGQAKGVAISRSSLTQYIESAIDFIELTKSDVVLQFATANFDAFVEQLFPTWAVGATVLMRDDSLWDADTLLQQIQQHQVSVMDLSAAYWRVIAKAWAQRAQDHVLSLPALRQVHSGGEAMSLQAIKHWQQAGLAHVRLLNTYGPTEIIVEAVTFDCQPILSTEKSFNAVPLGKALLGRQLYVLDEQLSLVAQGQIGELYVGGSVLARGYWRRPAQTASTFLADPFSDIDGARMYATGDLVSWQQGELHYHGRRDHQVKIRGFRVELTEIELHLEKLMHVEAAVVITTDTEYGLRLLAYLSSSHRSDLDTAAIKRALLEQLPHYMVPDHIEILSALPLNSSGKVDRKQLPKVQLLTNIKTIIPAKNEVEQKISDIWQHHLACQQLDRNSNFFDLGGHSLLLLAVHGDLLKEYPSLTVTELFTYPTVASLAGALTQNKITAESHKKRSGEQQRRGINAFSSRRRKITGS